MILAKNSSESDEETVFLGNIAGASGTTATGGACDLQSNSVCDNVFFYDNA